MANLVKDEGLSVEVLESMEPSELSRLAKEKAEEIFLNIRNASEKIKEAKEQSDEAANLDTSRSDLKNIISFGLLGQSREDKIAKRITLMNRAQKSQNEAMSELSNIVQQSIQFTQLTSKFSNHLQQAMSVLFKDGLRDANGNITKLSDKSAEVFCSILDAADRFVASQVRCDDKINQLGSQLEKQEQDIRSNGDKIGKLFDHMDKKGQIDQEQERLISENTKAIQELQSKIDAKVSAVAIVALLFSLVSLVLHFIKFID
ncbi:MAG: hypothetical protein ACTTH5_02220 [Wolinella sp.]